MEPGGRALDEMKCESLFISIKLRIPGTLYKGSQTVGAKLHVSKGKQPRSSSKVPKY